MKRHNKIENNTVGMYLELSNIEAIRLKDTLIAMKRDFSNNISTGGKEFIDELIHQLNLHVSQLRG